GDKFIERSDHKSGCRPNLANRASARRPDYPCKTNILGLLGGFDPGDPDIAGALFHGENQFVGGNSRTEPGLPDFVAGAAKVRNVKGGSVCPFCDSVQRLRPDALETVPLREEIQNRAIGRRPWCSFDARPICDWNPFAFVGRDPFPYGRYKYRRLSFLQH